MPNGNNSDPPDVPIAPGSLSDPLVRAYALQEEVHRLVAPDGTKDTIYGKKKEKVKYTAVPGWSDQCFLIDGWKTMGELNKGEKYKHIIPVSGISGAELISLLSSVPDAQNFFRLSPAQISLLVPQIRIFVVDYNLEGGNHEKANTREIYFDDHTRQSDIDLMLKSGHGRGSGAGLHSFTYTFDGTNPATAEKVVAVSMRMFFTDIERFTRPQDNGVSFVDLVERTGKFTDAARLTLNPNYRRIRATIGWAVPEGKSDEFLAASFLSSDQTKNMVGLLGKMQLNLALSSPTHELSFKSDGVIEFTANYRASIESEMDSAEGNLFYGIRDKVRGMKQDQLAEISVIQRDINEVQTDLGGEQAELAILDGPEARELRRQELRIQASLNPRNLGSYGRTAMEHQQGSNSARQLKNKRAKLEGSIKRITDAMTKLEEKASELEAASEAEINLLRFRVYQSFIKLLTERGLIRWVDIKRTDQQKWVKGVNELQDGAEPGTLQSLLKDTNTRKSADEILSGGEGVTYGRLQTSAEGSTTPVVEGGTLPVENGDIWDTLAQTDEALLAMDQGSALKPGYKRIFYVFYGDLLDTAVGIYQHNVKQSKRPAKMRMLVSDLTFFERSGGTGGTSVMTNLCDVPISLEEFTRWYKDKVISKMLTKFTLLQFIRESATNLITNALGTSCAVARKGVTSVGLEYVQMAVKDISKPTSEPLPPNRGKYRRMYGTAAKNTILTAVAKHRPGNSLDLSFIDYVVLHASSRPPDDMKGDVENDAKYGVYHLGIGRDRGIVRDIKFKATKMKYADEALIIDRGMENIGQLFKKYDAEVTLWGCPIFKNGAYVYLDPRSMGVERNTASLMGLGGYHSIYRVEGSLSSEGYFVTLHTKFNTRGPSPSKPTNTNVAETDSGLDPTVRRLA